MISEDVVWRGNSPQEQETKGGEIEGEQSSTYV